MNLEIDILNLARWPARINGSFAHLPQCWNYTHVRHAQDLLKMCMLASELGSHGCPASSRIHCAISPAPIMFLFAIW